MMDKTDEGARLPTLRILSLALIHDPRWNHVNAMSEER